MSSAPESPQSRRRRSSFIPSLPTTHEMSPSQARSSQARTSLLAANFEPMQALYHYYHLDLPIDPPSTQLPPTITFPVTREGHMPTHALALLEPNANPAQALIVPVDARLYMQGFRTEVLPPPLSGVPLPAPHRAPSSNTPVITLPVVPISVPHIHSMPLLLLFGLAFETNINNMASRLLPSQVIDEFPHAAAMSQRMAAHLSDEQLHAYVTFNKGLWKNILSLGLRDTQIMEHVQTVWNVTAEAVRVRQRSQGERYLRR
ncbi:hypothetical protein HGRIS_012491 [Hohenbuehelia grisea]|uniref:Uncharacterized protein n=1 Tax=Hohenbuehelia grisea TaxID=104357 RepID=A0ABR3ISF3_9AGAR